MSYQKKDNNLKSYQKMKERVKNDYYGNQQWVRIEKRA